MKSKSTLPDEMSADEYQELIVKKTQKRNKYHNIKTWIDGIEFDSRLEAQDYRILKDRLDRGEIRDLRLQPKYLLYPSFRYMGRTIRAITYIADFEYFDLETGTLVAHDSKGKRLPIFNIKEHLFLRLYGDKMELRVVGVEQKPKKPRKTRARKQV